MNKSILFKGIALSNFIILMIAFLFYRNGSFDNFIYNNDENILTSPNGGTPSKSNKNSSPTAKTDSLKKLRLSSSKSAVIIDKINLEKDTTTRKKKKVAKTLMPSSKSGVIFEQKQDKNSQKKKPKKQE